MTYSINDGIWGLFYILLFLVIMIMWMPSENTSAYAYHIQVSTSDEPVSKCGERWLDGEKE